MIPCVDPTGEDIYRLHERERGLAAGVILRGDRGRQTQYHGRRLEVMDHAHSIYYLTMNPAITSIELHEI